MSFDITKYIPAPDELITDELIDSIIKMNRWSYHGGHLDNFIEDLVTEKDLPDHLLDKDYSEIIHSPEFREKMVAHMQAAYRFAVKELSEIKEFPISVFRTLFLPASAKEAILQGEINDIGYFWGTEYSESYSYPFNEDEPCEMVEYSIEAKVMPENINWIETMISRLDWNNGIGEGEINTKGLPFPKLVSIYDHNSCEETPIVNTPQDNLYIHTSYDNLPTGTRLVPNHNKDYEKHWGQNNYYHGLEQNRPPGHRAQKDSIFMVKKHSSLDSCGAPEEGGLFFVKPHGSVTRHDIYWVDEIARLMEDGLSADSDEVKSLAKNYWNGIPSKNPTWEYKTNSATIVKAFEYDSWDNKVNYDEALDKLQSRYLDTSSLELVS